MAGGNVLTDSKPAPSSARIGEVLTNYEASKSCLRLGTLRAIGFSHDDGAVDLRLVNRP